MIDLHLINTALAALGIGTGVVLLIAAAVIVAGATGLRRQALHRSALHRSAPHRGRPAVTAAKPSMSHASGQAPREPALR